MTQLYGTTIRIKPDTKQTLDDLNLGGQSYDYVIKRLIGMVNTQGDTVADISHELFDLRDKTKFQENEISLKNNSIQLLLQRLALHEDVSQWKDIFK